MDRLRRIYVNRGRQTCEDANEQRSRASFACETIPALVWRAGPEGNIEYVNKRVLEYFGKPLGGIIGWGWMESVHPDDVAFKVETWLKNLQTETPHDAGLQILRSGRSISLV
jgi:PAS domain-containing protein